MRNRRDWWKDGGREERERNRRDEMGERGGEREERQKGMMKRKRRIDGERDGRGVVRFMDKSQSQMNTHTHTPLYSHLQS